MRTPHKEFVLKQFDTVLLKSGEAYQLCNTRQREECFFWAPAMQASTASPRTRVPKILSHIPVTEPVVA